ncbi:MAG: hypothetical protein KGH65_05620 [Candidatus Micrarchaeota archaeon]|nr:hypothetical protein [Candidatus Micrarchaeota archaeon]
MNERELLALIGSYEKSALGSSVSTGPTVGGNVIPAGQQMTTLEIDRYNALNAYFARPLGNEVENRSQIVLPELRDTIEWIMPTLMRMFAGTQKVCQFMPENPQDEDQAEMESAAVNHVFMNLNNGFFILHDLFKDALILRNGYASVYTEKSTKSEVEEYTGITAQELAQLNITDDQIQVLGQREYTQVADTPMGPQEIQVFDLKLRRTREVKATRIECLPPEECLVSPKARDSLDASPFFEHKTEVTRSSLMEMGYDQKDVDAINLAKPDFLNLIALARDEVTDQLGEMVPTDMASQFVDFRVVYIRVDFDGDGIAELRRVIIGGDKILDNDEIAEVPVAYASPIRMPHRHVGISYYDLLNDLQVIKTTLFRQALDNLYLSNNQRTAVNWRTVNLDDLLTNRPGGVIRVDGAPGQNIMPLSNDATLMQQIVPALEYVDHQREMRTGIGKDTMGVDADALQDVTKAGQLAAMSAAAGKVELVARLLAEGVKDLFMKIHAEMRRNQNQPMMMQLAGRWVQVDPSQWGERTQISVNVGLGSGNREESRANLMLLSQMQEKVAPFGLIGPKEAFETFKHGAYLLGFENPSMYAMDPDSQEYQQAMAQRQQTPPDPRIQAAQINAQAGLQKAKLQAQTTQLQTQSQQAQKVAELQSQLIQAHASEQSAQMQAQAEILHTAGQNGADRDIQIAQMQSQFEQTLIKVIGAIVAQQLKQNAAADAGAMVNKDVSEVERGS